MLDLRLLTGEYDNTALIHSVTTPKAERIPVLTPKVLRRLNAMPDVFSIKDWMRVNGVDKGSAHQNCVSAVDAGYLTSSIKRYLRDELIFTKTGKEVNIPEKRINSTTIAKALRLFPNLPNKFHLVDVADLAGVSRQAAHPYVTAMIAKGLVKIVGPVYHKVGV